MNINVYQRCLWLFDTLVRYKKLTFKEIQDQWESSYMYGGKPLNLRTFHLHRKAVEDMLNITIECDDKDNYRYYIAGNTAIQRDKTLRWLYNSFNVRNMVMEGKMMTDRILLEDIPGGTNFLQTVVDAMRQNRILEVEYQPFYDDQSQTYHIHPYCLKMYRMRWYVLGLFEEKRALRQFSLDRTLKMAMTGKEFEYPDDFSPEYYYKYAVGIWVNEELKPETVVLRAYGQHSKYLRTLPLHSSQTEINKTEEFADFQYRVLITRDLISEILQMGDKVEVLAPKELRKQVKDAAKGIVSRYKNNSK